MGCTLGPLGATGRAQQRSDETTLTVEDDNGLVAMHRVECVVDIEHDLVRCARKCVAVEPDHFPAHPDQRTCIGQIFHARYRGPQTQGRKHRAAPVSGSRSSAILKLGSCRKLSASLPSS